MMPVMDTTRLHIFQAGRRTDMSGRVLNFSEADLAATVNAYDPKLHEAPIVIGHPRHDAPAWGWVASLASSGADLQAEPTQVDPAFAELVGAGRYKKISSSFYAPDAPNNPVPGVYYLRHVGFLGAQPPSVKGLREVQFADAEEGVIEFADWGMETNATMWRRLRDWLLVQFGQDTADRVIPDWQIQSLQESARADSDDGTLVPTPAFAERTRSASVSPHQHVSDPVV